MLDRFTLISNSDCHSPSKLGREANLFSTNLDFFSIADAIRSNHRDTFRGTIEFFPEEGKYHADGHRACGVRLEPEETRRLNGRCPACGRPLTIGVAHRIHELADRREPLLTPSSPEVFSLIPLAEVLSEIMGKGAATKTVLCRYAAAVARFGSEFDVLLHAPLDEISGFSPLLGEALRRMRSGQVACRPGYDGEYGVVRLFREGELERLGPAP